MILELIFGWLLCGFICGHGQYVDEVCTVGRTGLKPYIVSSTQLTIATSGDTVRLYCNGVGVPDPSFHWFEGENGNYRKISGPHIFAEGGRLLILSKVWAGYGDVVKTFTCKVSNPFRTVYDTMRLVIRIPSRPSICYPSTAKVVKVSGNIGDRLFLKCASTGRPTPVISWIHQPIYSKPYPILASNYKFSQQPLSLVIKNVVPYLSGRYRCTATNVAGVATLTYIVVVHDRPPRTLPSDLFHTLHKRLENIKIKVAKTCDAPSVTRNIYDNFKDPKLAGADDIARTAEIYDSTVTFAQHTLGESSHRNEILSAPMDAKVLKDIEKLANCRDVLTAPIDCQQNSNYHSKYRTFDGTCNHLSYPLLGAALTPFIRLLEPQYEDGFSTPIGYDPNKKYFGYPKPPARLVSNVVMRDDRRKLSVYYSDFFTQFGQFLDHDINNTPRTPLAKGMETGIDCSSEDICEIGGRDLPCYPINMRVGHYGDQTSASDTRRCLPFTRSAPACTKREKGDNEYLPTPRQQVNAVTHYFDMSMVYGSNYTIANRLRVMHSRDGQMQTSNGGKSMPVGLPGVPISGCEESHVCYACGDQRANEQPGLMCFHRLFILEHNRIAKELYRINRHWDSDTIFLEARKIVGALGQHIIYSNYVEVLLGPEGRRLMGPYKGYNPEVNPAMSNVLAAAAFRYGHTLVTGQLHRIMANLKYIQPTQNLSRNFFNHDFIRRLGGCDTVMRGSCLDGEANANSAQGVTEALRNHLFTTVNDKIGALGLDLVSINIQRGRDHGLPGYNEWRVFCGLPFAKTFDDLKADIPDDITRQRLEKVYVKPSVCDIWPCGVMEAQARGSLLGPTFTCILADQFRRSRDGDRFYYENPGVFTPAQLYEIKKHSIARVLCDNSDAIDKIQDNPFLLPKSSCQLKPCDSFPSMNLLAWKEKPPCPYPYGC